MADSKITDLTAHTAIIGTDVLPIVDITAGITKKTTFTALRNTILAGVIGGTLLVGGTAVDDALQLKGTTGNGTLTSPAIQMLVGNNGATVAMTILNNGNVGIGQTTPTAVLMLKAGTATASTAPLKFTSGTLNTTAEAGAVEFLTDKFYGTITTGAARKTFAFLEAPVFTTNITTPLIIGGTAVGSNIIYKSTTGAGTAAGIAHQFVGGTDGATVAATILNNGNVGIGTTAPGALLHVNGNAIFGSNVPSLTATPINVSFGGTYGSNTPGSQANLKWDMYNASGANRYGIGMSAGLMEFQAGSTNNGNFAWYTGSATERMRLTTAGNVGIGTAAPTAVLHLKAGTATAETAPLKFTSGTLNTTAEAGAVEFLTDAFYGTITTGAARKAFVLDDGSRLTSGKIPVATTNGRLVDVTAQTGIATLKVDYIAGELDTEAKIITALNTTNTAINTLRTALNALKLTTTI